VHQLITLCKWYNPGSWPGCVNDKLGDAVNDTIGFLFGFIWDAIGHMIALAVEAVIKAVGTLWIYVPTLHVTEGGDYQPVATVSFMRGQVMWLVASAAVVCTIVAGIRMAYQQRGEPVRDLLKSLLTLVLVSFSGLAFVTVLTEAGDLLAKSFIDRAIEESGMSFAANLAALIAAPLLSPAGAIVFPTILIFGFAAVLMSFLQIMLMLVRNGMLILLAGVLPLAAAATNTEMGRSWFRKVTGWLIVFIAYKPFAALIYATAIMLAGAQDSLLKVITGLTMMALSIITLPALLRLVSPSGGS
jgi:hypothetical protein